MQLAARLTNAELRSFLSPCGKIREVRMVQDKVSRRSKGYYLFNQVLLT
jgi:RNA recognition motif-containing protein